MTPQRRMSFVLFLCAIATMSVGGALINTDASGSFDLGAGILLALAAKGTGVIAVVGTIRDVGVSAADIRTRAEDPGREEPTSVGSTARVEAVAAEAAPSAREPGPARVTPVLEEELVARLRSDMAVLQPALETLYEARDDWNKLVEERWGAVGNLPAGWPHRYLASYLHDQVGALDRAIEGERWGASLEKVLEEVERHADSVTLEVVLRWAIAANVDAHDISGATNYFQTVWDDGSGKLDGSLVRRDRNDLAAVLQRTKAWATGAIADLELSEEVPILSFLELDYAINHSSEIYQRYAQLLSCRTPESIAPHGARVTRLPVSQREPVFGTPDLAAGDRGVGETDVSNASAGAEGKLVRLRNEPGTPAETGEARQSRPGPGIEHSGVMAHLETPADSGIRFSLTKTPNGAPRQVGLPSRPSVLPAERAQRFRVARPVDEGSPQSP